MTITLPEPVTNTLDQHALDLYDNRLKPLLEPGENGRFVAIHPETDSYATGASAKEATRRLRETHPTGRVASLRIGSEPEYALAARYLAGVPVAI